MPPDGFQRQVNFRISADDWPLLEAAARDHGGIAAGLLAGLRSLAEKRLATARPTATPPAPAPSEPPSERPEQQRESEWWLELAEVASILNTKPPTVRRWAETSATTSFARDDDGDAVRLDTLEVPRHVASGLVGVKSATLGRRVKEGRLVEARPGYIAIGALELTTGQAAERLGVKSDTVRRRIAAGELPAVDRDGSYAIRLLDVVALID